MHSLLCLGLAALLSVAPLGIAAAHPHVWMGLEIEMMTEQGALAALDVSWTWDEIYSDPFRKTYDKNRNGRFEPAEAAALQQAEITSLAAFSDFVFVHAAGARVPMSPPQDLRIDLVGDQMRFRFRTRLTKPVPLTGLTAPGGLTVGSYDPEYYIESLLPEDRPGIRFAVPLPACAVTIIEDRKHPIYFGMVYPQVGAVACAE